MTHDQAKRALAAGTPADLICQTCPWDRLCVQPPAMSSAEIQRHVAEAGQEAHESGTQARSTAMLMAVAIYAGRDTAGQLCPVFASRLSSPDGRTISDTLREQMRVWKTPETSATRHAGQTTASGSR